MKGIPGKEYEPTCPECARCGHKVSEHNEIGCQHLTPFNSMMGWYQCACLETSPADLQPQECDHVWVRPVDSTPYCGKCGVVQLIRKVVEPAEKRYMVIVEGKQTPHYVHTNLKHAKNEAERLCTKEQRKTQVIEVIPIGHWETSHLSIWHEEQ